MGRTHVKIKRKITKATRALKFNKKTLKCIKKLMIKKLFNNRPTVQYGKNSSKSDIYFKWSKLLPNVLLLANLDDTNTFD